MKDNLYQECVKEVLLSFQGKIETIAPDFPRKNDSFSTFYLTFPPVRPSLKSGFLTQTNYISEMSNDRAICWKGFIMLSLRLWICMVAN